MTACCERVHDVLAVAATVYLGRTHHPERRLLEHRARHGRDHLLVLHWGAAWNEISQLEENIIARFQRLSRLQNESGTSDGRVSSPWNALYVSFSLKHGLCSMPGTLVVRSLHWRHRLWPDPSVPCRPVLLRAALDEVEAVKILAAWKSEHSRRAEERRVSTGKRARRGPGDHGG
ncbi:MAG: hypothetical protein KC636_27875 [Myxococcales bacterium]|nr:hypothetical protein [Myxococcales bacterium]